MKVLRTTASLVAATLLITALAGTGVASAATATAKLTLYSGCVNSFDQHFDYTLKVSGSTAYNPSARMRVQVRVWGEDEWYDDLLVGPITQSYDWWGPFDIGICVNASTLNEDIGQDDIYAGVRFYNAANGQQITTAETNRIYGYF